MVSASPCKNQDTEGFFLPAVKQIIPYFLTLSREGCAAVGRKAAGWLPARIRPRTLRAKALSYLARSSKRSRQSRLCLQGSVLGIAAGDVVQTGSGTRNPMKNCYIMLILAENRITGE